MIGAYYYDSAKHYIMYSIQNFNDLKYVLKEIFFQKKIIMRRILMYGMNILKNNGYELAKNDSKLLYKLFL